MPAARGLVQTMAVSCAGRVQRGQAAVMAGLLVLLLLWGFWRVGMLWPGVPLAEEGLMHMNQVGRSGRQLQRHLHDVHRPRRPCAKPALHHSMLPPISRCLAT